MARCGKLDVAGSAALILSGVALILFACCAAAQTTLDRVQRLAREQRWPQVVSAVESAPARSADLDYYYGIALARLGRWDDAHAALESGRRRQPLDKRFPLELAGVAFHQRRHEDATRELRRALRLDPADAYANDFLASVYFIQGNVEAAVESWNRMGKPRVEQLTSEPAPRLDPALLDRAFAFAPASTLRLRDLWTTESRTDGLGVFPSHRLDLVAREDGSFDAVFRAHERNGWGDNTLTALAGLFRELPYQGITPDYFNLGREAINVQSLVRWDAQKRRLLSDVSGPWRRNPKWRWHAGADLREENWDLLTSFTGPASLLGALNLQREQASFDITSFASGRWNWSTGAEWSHRDFRSVFPGVALTPGLLSSGMQLKHLAALTYDLLRLPARRFTLSGGGSSQIARLWSEPSQSFAKLQASALAHWFPRAVGDDFETFARFRAGKTYGDLPFDELYMLGVERDNDLWLRGHVGTRDGRKGSAPLGRNYLLANWECDKNIYQGGWITVKLGPFVDTGKITNPVAALGSKVWLWDVGAQVKVRVLGVGVGLSYGKDLRTGNNAVYTTTGR